METNKDFTFEVLISKDCYAAKPEHSQYELMEFQKVVVNPTTLLDYVRQGHSFCHVHKNERRLKGNFKYTNFVNIDIDDSTVSMSEFLKRPIIKPTLAYTTFSNKILGYRYRLLYCFSEPIDAQTYVPLYRWICAYIGLSKTKDHCGHVTNQLMNGNSLADIELYLSNRIYKISDFVQPGLLELQCGGDNAYNSKKPNNKKRSNTRFSKIVSDLRKLELDDFLDRYAYLGIVKQTELKYNEQGYSIIPESFYKVFNRIVWSDKQARICPFKDGEGRRKRLYVDACVIRKIEPDISFKKMLYNLVYRRYWFYDNSDNVLTNNVLIEKANYVLALPLSDLDVIKPTKHGKFTTSKEYCDEHDINRRCYARTVQKELNYQSIGEWYDLGRSVSENLQYAKHNNIKVSLSTLKKFCKEQNIDTNPRHKPIETWYNPAFSIKANLQIALQHGIKISMSSLYNYCKVNGINPKGA